MTNGILPPSALKPYSLRRPTIGLGLIVLIFILQQCAQLAATPFGETMDFFGHLAYIAFMADQGHAPTFTEISVPVWVANLSEALGTPDGSTTGVHYHAWASLPSRERLQRSADIVGALRRPEYVGVNYESQHPPLYYWVMSGFYRVLDAALPLDQLAFTLGVVSICLAAVGFPAIYLTFRLHLEEGTALLGLLALAWYPNLLVLLGRITNDALAFPLIAWALYFCVSGRQRQPMIRLNAAGLLLALAIFTKTYALTLIPVYLACAFWGVNRRKWRFLMLAGAWSAAAAGAIFVYNYLTTGHIVLLTEMRGTDAMPLPQQLLAVGRLDWIWFFGGLAKGFWWSGGWSFVTPGLFYYLPPALLLALLKPPVTKDQQTRFFCTERLWPHYLAIASFVAGMVWHAATFSLYASQFGQTVHSGNEGWYSNVLIGSVFAVVLLLMHQRLHVPQFRLALAGSVVFFIVWNLVARAALAAYWAGLAGVEGRLRGVRWDQVASALMAGRTSLEGWLSLPGVIGPPWLTFGVPLGAAILLSAALLLAWRRVAMSTLLGRDQPGKRK